MPSGHCASVAHDTGTEDEDAARSAGQRPLAGHTWPSAQAVPGMQFTDAAENALRDEEETAVGTHRTQGAVAVGSQRIPCDWQYVLAALLFKEHASGVQAKTEDAAEELCACTEEDVMTDGVLEATTGGKDERAEEDRGSEEEATTDAEDATEDAAVGAVEEVEKEE